MKLTLGTIKMTDFNIVQWKDGTVHITRHDGEGMEVTKPIFEKYICDFYDKYF